MSMTSLASAFHSSRLGAHFATLASVSLCLVIGCSAGGGTPGNSDSGATTLTVGNSGGKYSLSFGQTYVEVDPANGGRVSALRIGGATGMNLLLDSTVNAGSTNADNWGSVFWPSPQSSWIWPPTDAVNSIGAIDSAPYAATMDATSFTVTSGMAPMPSVSVSKKFSADLSKEAIVIDYTVTNGGAAAVNVAPWEISRVPGGGITFYGTGMDMPHAGNFPLPEAATITVAAGATWYKHDTTDATDRKLLADGAGGWLATANGDSLLVKSFPDVPLGAAAAGEAEIEIYASVTTLYVEVEQQGAVRMLAPGASFTWTVRWYVRTLSAPAAVGGAGLVTYVQNLIK